MSVSRRNQLLTDDVVQGELLFRVILYWFFCLAVVSLLVIGWSMYSGPAQPLSAIIQDSFLHNAPAFFGSILLLPLVLMDVLRLSSRFVGPIQQVRHALRRAASGEPARPVALRKDDFWQDLAQYANEVVAQKPPTKKIDEETARTWPLVDPRR